MVVGATETCLGTLTPPVASSVARSRFQSSKASFWAVSKGVGSEGKYPMSIQLRSPCVSRVSPPSAVRSSAWPQCTLTVVLPSSSTSTRTALSGSMLMTAAGL